MTQPVRWALSCTAEEFAALRGDAQFALLLRFARAANALRFATAVLTEGEEDGTPQRHRQRLNAFMLLAAIVADTIRLASSAERALEGSAAFASGFRELLDDAGAVAYAEDVLGAVAARRPFGFGPVPSPGAEIVHSDEVVFGAGEGRVPGAFHYSLADELLLRGGIELPAGGIYESIKEHFATTVLLADRCADAADRLIAELLREQPWRLSQR